MGFFSKILSSASKATYGSICKTMIVSYYAAKEKHPDKSKRELYAMALSTRPGWKREKKFIFKRGNSKVVIEEDDIFENVVRQVVIAEMGPKRLYPDPNYGREILKEISSAVVEAFRNFEE